MLGFGPGKQRETITMIRSIAPGSLHRHHANRQEEDILPNVGPSPALDRRDGYEGIISTLKLT